MQRADRAYGEILQEVRVAQTGVQILFAFLLTLAFTARFRSITQFQREIYVVTLMLAAAAAALLIAPAAFHRVVASGMLAWFFSWWFLLPAWSRIRHSAWAGGHRPPPG